jgi:hypothetical protein
MNEDMNKLKILLREIDYQIAICRNRNRMENLKGQKMGVMLLIKLQQENVREIVLNRNLKITTWRL